MPLNEAAAHFGVSVAHLKRMCSGFGINQWPYTKIANLEQKIQKERGVPLQLNLAEHKHLRDCATLCRFDGSAKPAKSVAELPFRLPPDFACSTPADLADDCREASGSSSGAASADQPGD